MEVIIASGVASIASALIVGVFKEHQLQEERHARRRCENQYDTVEANAQFYKRRAEESDSRNWKQAERIQEVRNELEVTKKQLQHERELKEETLEELEQLETKVYFLEDLLKTMAAASAIQRTREEDEPCSSIQ